MTSTEESTRPIPLIGQAVGQAQASLAKILLGILAETQGGTIRLSAQGRGLREGGLAASAKITGPMLDEAGREDVAATLGQLPPPLRLLYRAVWKPRFNKTPRW